MIEPTIQPVYRVQQSRFRKNGQLKSSSILNEVNNQYDDRNYEQEMDQATANVADEAKEPEHD
jgi:hypothetical protein